MATAEAKPMLKVTRADCCEGYSGSVLASCAFCHQEVWVSKAAVPLLGDYVLACEKCAPGRSVKP